MLVPKYDKTTFSGPAEGEAASEAWDCVDPSFERWHRSSRLWTTTCHCDLWKLQVSRLILCVECILIWLLQGPRLCAAESPSVEEVRPPRDGRPEQERQRSQGKPHQVKINCDKDSLLKTSSGSCERGRSRTLIPIVTYNLTNCTLTTGSTSGTRSLERW